MKWFDGGAYNFSSNFAPSLETSGHLFSDKKTICAKNSMSMSNSRQRYKTILPSTCIIVTDRHIWTNRQMKYYC